MSSMQIKSTEQIFFQNRKPTIDHIKKINLFPSYQKSLILVEALNINKTSSDQQTKWMKRSLINKQTFSN